jgi:hypothetical protein
MALPPSQFKNLIAGKSSEELYRVLRENQFLARTDRATRREIIAIAELATHPREPDPLPMPGPTPLDNLASKLLPFLNEQGTEAYYRQPCDEPPPPPLRPWWKWW